MQSFFRTGWKRFYLKWYDDQPHPSAARLCPHTTEILKNSSQIKAAALTQLPPGSMLGKHRGPFAGSLRYHFGLITPNDDRCWIRVDGNLYSWRDGEGVVFDERKPHLLGCQRDRAGSYHPVLRLERPMKYRWAAALNHAVARTLLHAGASPNQEGDRTCGVNRIFKYAYAIRRFSRAIKQRNRNFYYAAEWTLLVLLHKDGKSIQIIVDALPVSDKVTLHKYKTQPKE